MRSVAAVKVLRLLLMLQCPLLLALGAADPATHPANDAPPGWQLVWADEFDYGNIPDPARWSYEKGYIRNREAQYYTANRAENARIEDGCLVIEARADSLPVNNGKVAKITSAAIETRDHLSWKYGRVEVRAKIPVGKGTWPAIWMMPQDRSAGWPACGEIDIMENVGFQPDVIHQTIHTQAANHVKHNSHGTTTRVSRLADDFHVYAMQWDESSVQMFIDGKQTFEFQKPAGAGPDVWPFDKPFYVILNVAIGGAWGGQRGIDPAIFPCRMLVDYVRVYQRESGQ
jgi:beta-glucanase (GH16 family)